MIVESFESGEDAMPTLERRDFDLLLFDVQMPIMSGYALCCWYKEMCANSGRTPGFVVAITADPDYSACEQFGIDRCLPKPLSTAMVVRALDEFRKKRGSPFGTGGGKVAGSGVGAAAAQNPPPTRPPAAPRLIPSLGTSVVAEIPPFRGGNRNQYDDSGSSSVTEAAPTTLTGYGILNSPTGSTSLSRQPSNRQQHSPQARGSAAETRDVKSPECTLDI
jgi:CheY-like chemotaxis protein